MDAPRRTRTATCGALRRLAAAFVAVVAFPALAGDAALPVRDARDAQRTTLPGPDMSGWIGVVAESSASGVRVTRVIRESPADAAGLRPGDLLRSIDGESLTTAEDLDRVLLARRPGDVVAVAAVRSGTNVAATARLTGRRVRDGLFRGPVFRLAVVPIRFSGDTSVSASDDALRRMLFARTGRDGAGASLADYYATQSFGRLTVEGDVLAPVVLPRPRSVYAGQPMGAEPGSAWQDAADALAARTGSASLADYDGVAFLYPGEPESRPGHALWPHRSTIAVGARRVPYYVHGTGSKEGMSIGVHCHEFGHLLGLPDTYGAGHRTGLGDFCVMAIGHRGGPESGADVPFSMSAPARIRMGWIDPVQVDPRTPQRLRLAPSSRSPDDAVLVPLDPRCEEYLVLENRARSGYDAELPSDGLLVWRVNGRGTPGQGMYSQPVDLLEAHGLDVFDASLVRIDEIAFPTARARDITADTRPAIRPSARISFPCAITDIVRERDGSVTFTLGAAKRVRQDAPAPYASERPDSQGFVVRRDPVTGEEARFYVGPRESAPAAPEPSGTGQQERR